MRTRGFGVLGGLLLLGAGCIGGNGYATVGVRCGPELVEEARPRVFDLPIGVHVVDPLGQIDRNAPFSVALSDEATRTRIAFLARRASQMQGRIKIVLNRHDTHVFRSWLPDERKHFVYEDWESSHAVILEWADWQDENAEVLFYGALVEASLALLAESPVYREHLELTLDESIALLRDKAARWQQGSDEDRRDAEALQALLADPGKLRWQLLQTFHLRNAWMAKIHFYRKQLSEHPELAFVDGVPSAPTLRKLMALEEALEHAPCATEEYDEASRLFEDRFRAELTALYSQHDGYRLRPALVRAAWTAMQPRLLESSLVCPELLLEPRLFP